MLLVCLELSGIDFLVLTDSPISQETPQSQANKDRWFKYKYILDELSFEIGFAHLK